MTVRLEVPEGFVFHSRDRAVLVADAARLDDLLGAGLDRPERWSELLAAAPAAAGRGPVARLRLADASGLVLKEMRRGGLTGPCWRGRFAGTRRLLDNLRIPLTAAARGLATPAPVALLLLPGPPGFWRGWLAVEEIEAATELGTLLLEGPAAKPLAVAMRLVRRMHDAGVDHRDLNLGNLLVRGIGSEEAEAFVIDLDGARLRQGPLPFRARELALHRMERSWIKRAAGGEVDDGDRDALYRLYAGDDAELAARLKAGRASGRRRIRLHRLGWRHRERRAPRGGR